MTRFKPDFHLVILDTRPTRRGAQVFASELSIALAEQGLRVTKVYLYNAPQEGRLELQPQDIVLNGNDNHLFEKFPTIHPLLLNKLASTLNHLKPSVILLNGSRTLKYASAVKRFLSSSPIMLYRVIDSVRFWNNNPVKQAYYRRLVMPAIDAAVGVSKTSLDEMIGFHHFQKPARAIPRAIDAKRFAPKVNKTLSKRQVAIESDRFVVLFLGNFTRQKRPDSFVDIIINASAAIPNILGLMVGDGVLRQETEALIADRKVQHLFKLTGYSSDVIPMLHASDVLVLCSDTEGLPGVVLEAAASGIPAVAASVGGVKECIEDNVTGKIVDPNDLSAYVSQLLEWYNNPELLHTAGRQATLKIETEFNLKKVTEGYMAYLAELTR